jgi:hypothetical protein
VAALSAVQQATLLRCALWDDSQDNGNESDEEAAALKEGRVCGKGRQAAAAAAAAAWRDQRERSVVWSTRWPMQGMSSWNTEASAWLNDLLNG